MRPGPTALCESLSLSLGADSPSSCAGRCRGFLHNIWSSFSGTASNDARYPLCMSQSKLSKCNVNLAQAPSKLYSIFRRMA